MFLLNCEWYNCDVCVDEGQILVVYRYIQRFEQTTSSIKFNIRQAECDPIVLVIFKSLIEVCQVQNVGVSEPPGMDSSSVCALQESSNL